MVEPEDIVLSLHKSPRIVTCQQDKAKWMIRKILVVISVGSGGFLYLQWKIGTSWNNLTLKLYKPCSFEVCCNPTTLKNEPGDLLWLAYATQLDKSLLSKSKSCLDPLQS